MGIVQLDLVKVSFKRNHPDWDGEIELDLHNNDSPCVLVGKNAGGKSLALKAIKKFTDLLVDPTNSTKQDFEKLVNLTGISDMKATYRGSLYHTRVGESTSFDFFDIQDESKAKSLSGLENVDHCVIDTWGINVETVFKRRRTRSKGHKISYKRRYSDEIELSWFSHKRDTKGKRTGPYSNNPKWFEIFDREPETDRMAYFGEYTDWFEEELGISPPTWYDDHDWWDRNKNWHFVPVRTHSLIVDRAYKISRETIDRLKPFNKYSKFNKTNMKWINKRLYAAFKHAENRAKLQYDGFAQFIETRRGRKETGVFKDLNLNEEKLIKKIFKFNLVYPNAKLFTNSDLETNFRSVFGASWFPKGDPIMKGIIIRTFAEGFEFNDHRLTSIFHEFEPPTCATVFDPEHFYNCEKRSPPENLRDLYSNLIPQCGEMIRENDPDWWFWIVVSDFLDYPEYSETTYYSSGQRRLIAILETIEALDQKSVILLDEPELSLHIDWQRKFISKIGKGKKMILATHSPDIIYDHVEKVIEVPPDKGV